MTEAEVQQRRLVDLEEERDSLASKLAAAEAAATAERARAARVAETMKTLSARLAQEKAARAQAEDLAAALGAERDANARLKQEVENLRARGQTGEEDFRRQLAEALGQARELPSLQAAAEDLRRQLAEAQDQAQRLPNLYADVEDLKRQLAESQGAAASAAASNRFDSDALTAALNVERETRTRLEREVAAAATSCSDSAALTSSLGAERQARGRLEQEVENLRVRLAGSEQERQAAAARHATAAKTNVSSTAATDAEAVKLRRELSGMKVVVKTLEKKVELYQKRLLDQARKCAEELNDMKMNPSSESSRPSSEAGDKVDDDDDDDDEGDFEFSLGLNLGLGNGQWLPPKLWKSAGDIVEGGYAHLVKSDVLEDMRTGTGNGDGREGAMSTTPSSSATENHAEQRRNPGTYQPPAVPDAI